MRTEKVALTSSLQAVKVSAELGSAAVQPAVADGQQQQASPPSSASLLTATVTHVHDGSNVEAFAVVAGGDVQAGTAAGEMLDADVINEGTAGNVLDLESTQEGTRDSADVEGDETSGMTTDGRVMRSGARSPYEGERSAATWGSVPASLDLRRIATAPGTGAAAGIAAAVGAVINPVEGAVTQSVDTGVGNDEKVRGGAIFLGRFYLRIRRFLTLNGKLFPEDSPIEKMIKPVLDHSFHLFSYIDVLNSNIKFLPWKNPFPGFRRVFLAVADFARH